MSGSRRSRRALLGAAVAAAGGLLAVPGAVALAGQRRSARQPAFGCRRLVRCRRDHRHTAPDRPTGRTGRRPRPHRL